MHHRITYSYTDTPGRALSGRRGRTLSGLCMRPGQHSLCLWSHWCRLPQSYCWGLSSPSHCRSWYWSQRTYLRAKPTCKKSEDAPFGSCQWTSRLTHQWRCVWMCQRWSKPALGRVRCTGRTLAVRRPGAHTPCLVLRKRNRSLCHGSVFLGYLVPGFCSNPLSFLPSCLQEKLQRMTNQLSPPPLFYFPLSVLPCGRVCVDFVKFCLLRCLLYQSVHTISYNKNALSAFVMSSSPTCFGFLLPKKGQIG